ncbi:hypothetical protein H920_20247 [Fukomys damarensis]|uniref:Uncharacterized protein n=1 Tax=Fukomys damarensis TaxID=885580 RepID=A0A091CMP5_FUKDA|nr:hypothetical protein H920_20247 [Fukomys damarensis]
MASSLPNSNSPDTGDCNFETASRLSISVGYFPGKEDTISVEETILLEDPTSNVCSSDNLIPPIQGTWGTEGADRRILQQNLIQDNPQQICKLGIITAWADNDDFEELTAHENLNGGQGLLDRCPKDETKLTEDKLEGLVKLEKNKEDDFDWFEVTSVEDLSVCNSSPPDKAQMECEVTGNQNMGTVETLNASKQPEEEDTQTTTCLRIGQAFRWLKKRILLTCQRRRDNSQATKSHQQQTPKRRWPFTSKKIQPEHLKK